MENKMNVIMSVWITDPIKTLKNPFEPSVTLLPVERDMSDVGWVRLNDVTVLMDSSTDDAMRNHAETALLKKESELLASLHLITEARKELRAIAYEPPNESELRDFTAFDDTIPF